MADLSKFTYKALFPFGFCPLWFPPPWQEFAIVPESKVTFINIQFYAPVASKRYFPKVILLPSIDIGLSSTALLSLLFNYCPFH